MDNSLDFLLSFTVLHTKISKAVDRKLSLHGVTFSEFLVMHQLSLVDNHAMRRIDLAERVGMSASGVTRLINPMEKLKIVEKEANPRDARVSLVKLTPAGHELLKNVLPSITEAAEEIFTMLGNKKVQTLLQIIKTIL